MASKKRSPSTPPAPDPVQLLERYRERLARLLENAEAAAPREPPLLRVALEALVEDLNADLLRLYRVREAGALSRAAAEVAVPALERLRNILRQRDARVRAMRDTLHKAVASLPPPRVRRRRSPQVGSS